MRWASVFLVVMFLLLIIFSGQGGHSTGAYVALKPEPGRVTVFRLVGSERSSTNFTTDNHGITQKNPKRILCTSVNFRGTNSKEQVSRLREIVRERGGAMQEIRLEELPVVLSCGSDRVKVEQVPWLLLVDAEGRIRYESPGDDLSDLSAWMDFLEQHTDIDESTWAKIKELFR